MNEELTRLAAALEELDVGEHLLSGVERVEQLACGPEPVGETRRVLETDRREMDAARPMAHRLVGIAADAARVVMCTSAAAALVERSSRYETLTAEGSSLDSLRREIRVHIARRVRMTHPEGLKRRATRVRIARRVRMTHPEGSEPGWVGYDEYLSVIRREDVDDLDWNCIGVHLMSLLFARLFLDAPSLRVEFPYAVEALGIYRMHFHSDRDHEDHADWKSVGEYRERLLPYASEVVGQHLHGCWLLTQCFLAVREGESCELASRLTRHLRYHRRSLVDAGRYLIQFGTPVSAPPPLPARLDRRGRRGRPRSPAKPERDAVIRTECRTSRLGRDDRLEYLQRGYPEYRITQDIIIKALRGGRK